MVMILIQQILVMVVMMAVGVVLTKVDMLDEHGVAQLSNIALYVATPCVIVRAFAIDYDPVQLATGGVVVGVFTLLTVISIVIARIVCGRVDRVGQYAVIFSNLGFIGIPIITSLLGAEYVFYVTMTMAVATLFCWTYGVYLMSGDLNQVSLKKIITNPAVISLGVGLALFFAPVELPFVIDEALDTLGSLNTGLAMLVLGANLGASNIGLMVSDHRLYKASVLRLIVVPLVSVPVLLIAPLSYEVKMTLFVLMAAPAGTATAMFAQMFGADYHYGTGLSIMTTLLSMLSMPVMLALALRLL